MTEKSMTDRQVLHIFGEIASGRGQHSDFLRCFAEAVQRADDGNFALLLPIALLLISKYGLETYLDNFIVPYRRVAWASRNAARP